MEGYGRQVALSFHLVGPGRWGEMELRCSGLVAGISAGLFHLPPVLRVHTELKLPSIFTSPCM